MILSLLLFLKIALTILGLLLFHMNFRIVLLGIYNSYVFLINLSLMIIYCPSLSLVTIFDLESVLSDASTITHALFGLPFAWNIFFHPFIFNLCVSSNLKRVACRSSIIESCFLCIHPLYDFDWGI